MKDGLYVSGRCPFGYMKDPNNKNHLVINNEQADTVKLIFNLALKGNTYHYIAQYLTERKIKTPASYYNYVWNTKCTNTKKTKSRSNWKVYTFNKKTKNIFVLLQKTFLIFKL